jgi:hypothetical protein
LQMVFLKIGSSFSFALLRQVCAKIQGRQRGFDRGERPRQDKLFLTREVIRGCEK